MRRSTPAYLLLLFTTVMLMAACQETVWNDIPTRITEFISEYFNQGKVESYVESDNGYVVTIKGGAQLSFDEDMAWTDVNGRGEILPQQFLFDCLPSPLYDHLEAIEATQGVYRVRRTFQEYSVVLLDNTITYNPRQGRITSR